MDNPYRNVRSVLQRDLHGGLKLGVKPSWAWLGWTQASDGSLDGICKIRMMMLDAGAAQRPPEETPCIARTANTQTLA